MSIAELHVLEPSSEDVEIVIEETPLEFSRQDLDGAAAAARRAEAAKHRARIEELEAEVARLTDELGKRAPLTPVRALTAEEWASEVEREVTRAEFEEWRDQQRFPISTWLRGDPFAQRRP